MNISNVVTLMGKNGKSIGTGFLYHLTDILLHVNMF